MDFRSIWVGFGEAFGGFRENFGAFFRNFFRIFSNFFGTCFALRFNLARKGLAYFVQVFLCQGLTLCVFLRKKPYFCWTHFALQPKFVYVRTPALSRVAPRSVSMRGGPLPPACWTQNHIVSHTGLLWKGFALSWGGYAETVAFLGMLLVGVSFRTFS